MEMQKSLKQKRYTPIEVYRGYGWVITDTILKTDISPVWETKKMALNWLQKQIDLGILEQLKYEVIKK